MVETGETWRLDGETITLVFIATGQDNINLAYFGRRLPEGENLDALARSGQFGKHENQPDTPPVGGFLPNVNAGYRGSAALQLQRADQALLTRFILDDVSVSQDKVDFIWLDADHQLELQLCWEIRSGDMIYARYTLKNEGEETAYVREMASVMLPLPAQLDRMTQFAGRWTGEMQAKTRAMERGSIELMSHGGKSGFSGGDWLVLDSSHAAGALGYHFAWSGDHRVRIEVNEDGEKMLIGGSAPEQSAIPLGKHEIYQTPVAMFALATDQAALTAQFHQHVRSKHVLHRRDLTGPRKVHLNSWEALGFDLDESRLIALADHAAEIGIERFVLDDGWFKGRRSTNAGLGDWTVDTDLFPLGLKPLIDHVQSRDMDFGLWVEPEMVSPDSDLYRAHPDWVLSDRSNCPATERHQLALDLCHQGVADHLFACIDRLLSDNDISYLKWDHNRRNFPLASGNGIPEYMQTVSLYALLDRIQTAHPDVEIETCSSGGGRVDLAILGYCTRVWPSDNNDPIARLRIMDSWTRFLPLEVLGNHVGPSPNPVTGRRSEMDFRAKVALFGHMGVEANPADMSPGERANLKAHIALYKEWRALLHSGDFRRLHHPDEGVYGQIAVGETRALAMAAQTRFAEYFNVAPLRLPGLDPDAYYEVTLPEPWPEKASAYLTDPDIWRDGMILSGMALAERGLALPLTHPETAWLIALEKVKS
jgi:alpha-galactosidase